MAMMRGPRTMATTKLIMMAMMKMVMVLMMSVFKSIRAAGMRPPIHREFHSHSFVSLPSPPPTSATFTCLDAHAFQPFSSSILLFLFLHLPTSATFTCLDAHHAFQLLHLLLFLIFRRFLFLQLSSFPHILSIFHVSNPFFILPSFPLVFF